MYNMAVTDILLDDNMEPIRRNGDFVIGDATLQNQKLLILTEKGELRQHPVSGVGVRNYLNDEDGLVDLQVDIQREFEADNMTVDLLRVKSLRDIELQGSYEDN